MCSVEAIAQANFDTLELEMESEILRLMKALSRGLDTSYPLLSLHVSNPPSTFFSVLF